MINRILMFSVSAFCLAIPVNTLAQSVYTVKSGNTSISLENSFLTGANLTVLGVGATGTPAPGFDAGFAIGGASDFKFELNPGFSPSSGTVHHSGFVQFDQPGLGNFSVGNFRIEYGTAAPGKLELYDSFLGTRLFEIGDPTSASVTGNDFGIGDSNLFVTVEFADFLRTPGLTGQLAGQLRIDGLVSGAPVPEPSTLFMVGVAAILMAGRRRR